MQNDTNTHDWVYHKRTQGNDSQTMCPYVGILLVDNILNVGAAFVYIIGVEDAAKPSTNNDDFHLFVGGIVEDDVWNLGTFWLEVLVAI